MSGIRVCLENNYNQATRGGVHVASGHRDTEFTRGVAAPLREFHRRHLGGAGQRRLLRQCQPHHRQDGMPDRPLASRRYRACARRGAQGEGRLGQHRAGQARRDPQQNRRPHGREPESSRRGRDHRQRQADPRDDLRRHSARHRSFPLFRRLRPRPGRIAVGDRSRHHRLPLSRAARRGRADHPVELPDSHGCVEARPCARRGKLHRAEAGGADADEHHGDDGS